MERISQEEFANRYGENTLRQFGIQKRQQKGVFKRVLSDLPSDYMQMGQRMGEQLSEAGTNIVDIARGEGTFLEKTLDIGAEAYRRGGRFVSEPYLFALKVPFTQEAEERFQRNLGIQAERLGGSALVRGGIQAYRAMPPEAQAAAQRIGGFAEGLAEILGLGKATKTLKGAVKETAERIPTPSRPSFEAPKFDFPQFQGNLNDFLQKARVDISDVDPQVETILKRQENMDKVNAYFDQAEKAVADPAVPMPTQLAADHAVLAFDTIGQMKGTVGRVKGEAIQSVADVPVPGNVPGRAIDSLKIQIGDRFGVQIDNAGNLTAAPGRRMTIDEKSQKLISDYVGRLRTLGPNPTAQQLDDFVDEVQAMLYKQSSPNLYELADEPVIAFLKEQTGQINSQLKTSIDDMLVARGMEGGLYSALNERWQLLNDMEGRLSKRLGADADKGASMMKSLFSPQTGEPTRRLFEQIRNETGIDLFEEATLAKFAMESVGDVRQRTLLKSLDIAVSEVAQVDLTKPGTWYNWLRERADLDGRDLANAIIEQAKKNPTTTAGVAALVTGGALYSYDPEAATLAPVITIAAMNPATRKMAAKELDEFIARTEAAAVNITDKPALNRLQKAIDNAKREKEKLLNFNEGEIPPTTGRQDLPQ